MLCGVQFSEEVTTKPGETPQNPVALACECPFNACCMSIQIPGEETLVVCGAEGELKGMGK